MCAHAHHICEYSKLSNCLYIFTYVLDIFIANLMSLKRVRLFLYTCAYRFVCVWACVFTLKCVWIFLIQKLNAPFADCPSHTKLSPSSWHVVPGPLWPVHCLSPSPVSSSVSLATFQKDL